MTEAADISYVLLQKSRIKQNVYLNKLGCALDTFLLNRDVQMIQFVTNLPKDLLSKE